MNVKCVYMPSMDFNLLDTHTSTYIYELLSIYKCRFQDVNEDDKDSAHIAIFFIGVYPPIYFNILTVHGTKSTINQLCLFECEYPRVLIKNIYALNLLHPH